MTNGCIEGVTFEPLCQIEDQRGWLMELFRRDELAEELRPTMAYISLTLPGVVRGPHEHREQTDIFAFPGPGDFRLYCWDGRESSPTHGSYGTWVVGHSNRCRVVVPPGVIHAYKNISDVGAIVINCPNRLYGGQGRGQPIDEIRYEDRPNNPYRLYEID